MENTNKDTNIIAILEQNIENAEVEQEQFFEDTNKIKITEEELKNVHTELNQNFPLPKMNSNLVIVHHNYPENFIDDPEDFH